MNNQEESIYNRYFLVLFFNKIRSFLLVEKNILL